MADKVAIDTNKIPYADHIYFYHTHLGGQIPALITLDRSGYIEQQNSGFRVSKESNSFSLYTGVRLDVPKGVQPMSLDSSPHQLMNTDTAIESHRGQVGAIAELVTETPESRFVFGQMKSDLIVIPKNITLFPNSKPASLVSGGFALDTERHTESLRAMSAGAFRDPRGTALSDRNLMIIEGVVSNTFREEVSHMIDYQLARELEMAKEDWGYSHALVTDGMQHADLKHLRENQTQISDRLNTIVGASDKAAGLVNLAMSQAEKVYTLPGYGKIRDSKDTDPDILTLKSANSVKDSETMVKFHVLRMHIEDGLAQIGKKDKASEADYYDTNPDRPAMKMLAELAPELYEAYRSQWLPAAKILTQVQDPAMRKALLQAHAQQLGDQGAREIKPSQAGVINPAEWKMLKESGAIELVEGTRAKQGAITMQDGVITLDGVNLPVKVQPEEGRGMP